MSSNTALLEPHEEIVRPELRGDSSIRPHRFTVSQLMVLSEKGFLTGHAELLDGRIYHMPPMGNAHAVATMKLYDRLRQHFLNPWFIRCQSTHRFGEHDAPEPDLAVLNSTPVAGALIDELPALVVEISDTTLDYDIGYKRLLYARYSVPEYWVVDVAHKRVYVFRKPDAKATNPFEAFEDESIIKDDGTVAPLIKSDAVIRVADFMPNAG